MNSLAIIIISLVLLVSPSLQGENEVKVLGYNPTYEIWFYTPTGRPKYVSPNVQAAYKKARGKGGVCYKDYWYYCKTGVKIEE